MNDGVVPDPDSYFIPQAWPSGTSFVFAQAPLVVSTLTLSSKVKPEGYDFLEHTAREVNQVWNFCNAATHKAWHGRYGETRQWLSAFDLSPLLVGCGEVFEKIGIDVAQAVSSEHAVRRSQFKKSKLRFRKSGGSYRSLGWIPFKPNGLRFSLHASDGKRVTLPNDPQPVVPAWPSKVQNPDLSEKENKAVNTKIRKDFTPIREAVQADLLAWENRRVQAASTIKGVFHAHVQQLPGPHRPGRSGLVRCKAVDVRRLRHTPRS